MKASISAGGTFRFSPRCGETAKFHLQLRGMPLKVQGPKQGTGVYGKLPAVPFVHRGAKMRQERSGSTTSAAMTVDAGLAVPKANGHDPAALSHLPLEELLEALQAMQAGDFSVRLPGSQTGIAG